jgi:hypothetical protein
MVTEMPPDRARELGIDAAEIEEGLARNRTFPARWYWDPRIFDLELADIFPRSWVFAAPLHKLARPGDARSPHPDRAHARPRGRAARVRERVPPSRVPGRDRRR